uniref:Uncharacterized protein n=1 Tax=Brassica oleracea TaxID=3712 RepID=A0A3P6CB48_BRAOL|nr:unnamed protein product [Brassica oleracea]
MSAYVSAECHSSSTVDPPSLIVFSGGTGFNGVVEELKKITTRVAHVLPVSDDGGSGPAVGDIRSRCLRLSDESTSEALAVRRLLGHRLPITLSSTISWKVTTLYGMVYQDPAEKQSELS